MVPPNESPLPQTPPTSFAPPPVPSNGLATTAMVLGIVGAALYETAGIVELLILRYFRPDSTTYLLSLIWGLTVAYLVMALLMGTIAVVLGSIGWRMAKPLPPPQSGRVQSVVGITLGIILLGRVALALIDVGVFYLLLRTA